MPDKSPHSADRRPAGFTLIELLVVISIIALLIGIAVPAALKMYGAADAGRVRSMLNGMLAAADEYNVKTGQRAELLDRSGRLRFQSVTGASVTVIAEDDPDNNTAAAFIAQVAQVPSTVGMLTSAGKKRLIRDNAGATSVISDPANLDFDGVGGVTEAEINQVRLLDAWDTPVRYAPFNRPGETGDLKDDDYLPAHPTPFFVSAGPDGEFGDVRDSATDEAREQAEDNIYSFESE